VEKKPLISIVDDDEAMREAAKGLMKSLGFAAEVFASAEEFLASSRIGDTSCLLTDINLPGISGFELYVRLSAAGMAIPTILITGYPDDGVRERALKAGVICYLTKPFDDSDVLVCIHSALARPR
jgi:FixJ family two-component response regulator